MTAQIPTKVFHNVRSYFERTNALAIISMLAIGGLVYGVFIPSLGFYWDDWPVVWVYNALGPGGLAQYFVGRRPVYGWIIANLAPILGTSPIGWQAVGLVVRCVSSVALFAAFCGLWPRRKDVAWLVGVIVLLYPGFTLQPIALSLEPYYLSFLFLVVSLATTIFSITKPAYRWLFLPISLILGGLSYLIIEYFLGVELFRLMIIVVLKSRESATWSLVRLRAAVIAWSPYAAVWTAYVVWRTFVFRLVSYNGTAGYMDIRSDVSPILSSPMHEVPTRVFMGIHNILMSTVVAWARPFSPELITLSSRSVHSWMIASIVAAIAVFTVRQLETSHQIARGSEPLDDESRRIPKSGFLLGVLGLGVAGLPLMVAALSIAFTGHPAFPDRWTLPFMIPASLTLSCLLASRGTRRLSGVLLVALMMFAFSAFQVQNQSLYRHDWLTQKSLFWQFAWRAPVLKQGTSILADGFPLSLYGNHSAGVLNLLYNRDDSAGHLDYFIFDLSSLSTAQLSWAGAKLSYRPGEPIVGVVREFQFQGNTAQSLVSWISPSGTFRIVTQPYVNEILHGSALCLNISSLSQPGEVISNAPELPHGPLLKIFGSELRHEWLYFYQKGELERQLKNWDAVAMLGDEVIKQGYKPSDPSEWFPFIEGYARAHRYQTAVEISNSMLEESPDALAGLSSLWLRAKSEDSQNSPELNSALGALEGKLMLRDRK
jgi:hypothetical protein